MNNKDQAEYLIANIVDDISLNIDVDDQKEISTIVCNYLIKRFDISNNVSDGYHTFSELYKHRIHLFIALCDKAIHDIYNVNRNSSIYQVSKSKLHHDGSEYKGYFIVQLETREGQISYHLPNEYWEQCSFIDTLDRANQWDGHISNDVLKRLLLI